jgi:hypothetical protein
MHAGQLAQANRDRAIVPAPLKISPHRFIVSPHLYSFLEGKKFRTAFQEKINDFKIH